MRECWAKCLSNCSETLTKEHLISASLFPKSNRIFVQGFPWCIDKQQEIGIASLTAKILCKHHNNNLSVLDSAAGHGFNNFEHISKLIVEANSTNAQLKIKESHVNALLLERWFLKTLINVCYKGNYLIGNSEISGIPEDDLVKICFGKSKFANEAGMYIAAGVGDKMSFGSHLILTPLIEKSENRVVGGLFEFAGLSIFLWLIQERLPNDFTWIENLNSKWLSYQPSRPFKKIKFKTVSGSSHTLYFHW